MATKRASKCLDCKEPLCNPGRHAWPTVTHLRKQDYCSWCYFNRLDGFPSANRYKSLGTRRKNGTSYIKLESLIELLEGN